ncbi:MAG: hypothetical protein JXR83_14870, partial [Deltaproteobacteria bacterium]|nr:hypothetical protein [Deltaproteobacteria bacterium]
MASGTHTRRASRSALSPLALFALSALLVGAAASVPLAVEPRDYELFCYCEARASTPQSIIRLDNNAEILWWCREPSSREQLRQARIDYRDSQLQLLIDWGLIEERGGRLATAFPILQPGQTRALRAAMQRQAISIADQTREDVARLRARLRQAGRERNTFTVLFSYVLDDLVWQRFAAAGALGPRELTLKHPLWDGVLWASYPP